MAGLQSNIDDARKAGYSDTEITQFLGQQKVGDVGGALKAGYSPSEILTHLGATPPPSGVIDSLREGVSGMVGGVGNTLRDYTGKGPVGDALINWGAKAAPKNFVEPRIVGEDGSINAGNIPAWIAERAPSMAAQIAAYRLLPGGLKFGGAAGLGTAMSAGNEANAAAANRTGDPNAAPNTADLTRGGLTAGAESAVGALPLSRFLPAAGPMAATGFKGVGNAISRLTGTAAAEGAAGAGQSVVGQVGQSVGTPGGVSVDPSKVADTAAGSALTGGVMASGRTTGDVLNATKYKQITPDLQPAATAFANRMVQNAGGENLNAGVVGGGAAQRAGADTFRKSQAAVKNELSSAVDDLRSRVSIPIDANNVLKAALNGQMPNENDYSTLSSAIQGDPQADNVINLVRQAHVADIVKETGHLGDNTFTGGVSSHVGAALTGHNLAKTALVGVGAAALEEGAGHLIAYSPEIMAMLAGGTALARLGDKLTGARSPAGRFVSNFADANTPTRITVPPAPQAPGAAAPGPTGPAIRQAPMPWGPPPAAPAEDFITQQQKRQMVMQATPALRTLAAQAGPNAMARQAMPMLRTLAAQSAQPAPASAPAAPAAPVEPATKMRGAVPADVLSNARAIVQGLKTTAKMQAQGTNVVPPQVTKVTKDGATLNTSTDAADGYQIPSSVYSKLMPLQAAQAILKDKLSGGETVKSKAGFITGATRNITTIRTKAAEIASSTPGVVPEVIAGQFEGVATQKEAIAHRNWLMQQLPQAAPALARAFSDEEIQKIWKRKG